jgi:LPXTG-site transpeptidase (sortase) family protein
VSSATQTNQKTPEKSLFWRWASLVFIIVGLVLMAMGGWIYYQQYLTSIQPPPARVVQLTLEELEATFTAEAALATPTAIVTATPSSGTPVDLTDNSELALPTLAPEEPLPAITPTLLPSDAQSTPESGEKLSLADNPLRVVEALTKPDGDLPDQLIVPVEGGGTISGTTGVMAIDTGISSTIVTPEPGTMLKRIVAEAIGMDAEVVPVGWETVELNGSPVSMWQVADKAAGWHKNSSLPGLNGNIVLSAHHNIKGEVFRYIVDLEPGDTVTLYNESDQAFDYIVADKFIVKDKGEPETVQRANARWIGSFDDERLTMVTCWPYTNNTHRVIVIAHPPVPDPELQELQITE